MRQREFDVCIIGTGITGTLVADHFLSRGASVLMLERGNDVYLPAKPAAYWRESWEKTNDSAPLLSKNTWPGAELYYDDLVNIENSREQFAFHYNMKYGLGGAGAVWSGASWRHTAQDFKTRSLYGYGRDWPFDYAQLAPYYDRVEQMFFTSGPTNEPDWPWKNNYKYPAFKQSYLDKVARRIFAPEYVVTPSPFSVKNLPGDQGGCIGAKNCVSRCPANARFRPDLHMLNKHFDNPQSDLTLAMETPCIKLNLGKDKNIDHVTVLERGQETSVKAKYYYLAANTIENLRLLQHSADRHQGTLANANGLLGSYFASHGAISMSITLDKPVYVARGRPTTSSVINTLNHLQRNTINSYMMEIWNTDHHLGTSPVDIFNSIRSKERHWGKTLFDKLKQADNRFAATFVFETEMRETNQVGLSANKDKYGLPLAKVDFKLSDRDQRTYTYLTNAARQLGGKSGVRSLSIPGYGLNGNHPVGGYVCGNDPATSVVDPWLRSHEHNNLYILGGGAFNATAALNPTHTIAALTLKSLDDERIRF